MKTALLLATALLVTGCTTLTPEQQAQQESLNRLYKRVSESLASKGYSTNSSQGNTYYHSYTGRSGTTRCMTSVYAPGVASSYCR